MNIGKKINTFLFLDICRSLTVALRYVFGRGAAQKCRRPVLSERRIPTFRAQKCTGCRLCVQICPTRTVYVRTKLFRGKSPVIDFHLDADRCVSCGLCVEACPEDALDFERENNHVCR